MSPGGARPHGDPARGEQLWVRCSKCGHENGPLGSFPMACPCKSLSHTQCACDAGDQLAAEYRVS
jgi:hypothetical protein